MKAILLSGFGNPDVLQIGETQTPAFESNEVLIKVEACGINRADSLQRKGMYPPPPGASEILGLEVSGTIADVGSSFTKWNIGDRVCALIDGGGYAEYVQVHEDMIIPLSDDMSFEEGAAIPEVFLTAFQSLHWLAELKSKETILVHAGASGVGTAAIQLAKLRNAKVIATASGGKHDICARYGADVIIDYKSTSFKEEIVRQEIKIDVILDFIAGAYFSDNLDVLSLDGRMVMLAALGGLKAEDPNVGQIVWKRLKVMGSTLRARSIAYKIALTKEFVETIYPSFKNGNLSPVIHQVYDWTEVSEAHRMMERNENAGKLILKIN